MFRSFLNRKVLLVESFMPSEKDCSIIQKQGTRDGKRGGISLAHEAKITQTYNATALSERGSHLGAKQAALDAAKKAGHVASVEEVDTVTTKLKAELRNLLTRRKPELANAWQQVRQVYADWQAFRTENDISRPANYPESTINTFATVFLLCLGEAGLCGYFYGSVLDNGYVGAILLSLTISSALVGAGAMTGFFALRNCFSNDWRQRVFGCLGTGLFLIFSLLMALLTASFRDAIAGQIAQELKGVADVVPAAMAMVSSTFKTPGELSFDSILLLVISQLIGWLAVYKGLHASDIVPGYALVDRQYQQTVARYKAIWEAIQHDQDGPIQEAVRRLDQLLDGSQGSVRHREEQISTAKSIVEKDKDVMALIQGGCLYCIQLYREAAASVQQPVPEFPAMPTVVFEPIDDIDILTAEATLVEEKQAFAELRDAVNAARPKVACIADDAKCHLDTYRTALEAQFATIEPPRLPHKQ